jgi:hypothetical protein
VLAASNIRAMIFNTYPLRLVTTAGVLIIFMSKPHLYIYVVNGKWASVIALSLNGPRLMRFH